jgi:hypothetical protein
VTRESEKNKNPISRFGCTRVVWARKRVKRGNSGFISVVTVKRSNVGLDGKPKDHKHGNLLGPEIVAVEIAQRLRLQRRCRSRQAKS